MAERVRKITTGPAAANRANDWSSRLLPIVHTNGQHDVGQPRRISRAQWEALERHAAYIFQILGMPVNTPGTRGTPRRFIRALYEATEGYDGDRKLFTAFPTECDGGPDCQISQIVQGPIAFHSVCEHHAFPFFGQAWVGYIAHDRIIGISKLTRIVRLYARRFTVQERLGRQIVDSLDRVLNAHGVAVYLDAVHLCMQMRGVREQEATTQTTFWRGLYESDSALRGEFLSSCRCAATDVNDG